MIRIGESRKMPTAAISVASVMKIRKLAVRVGRLRSELLDLLPDDRVRRVAGRRALGRFGRPREHDVELLDRDRAALGHAELLQVGEHDAGRLARHVAQEHVALRAQRGAAQHHDVAGARRLLEHTQHPLGQVRWDDDAQVDHGRGR